MTKPDRGTDSFNFFHIGAWVRRGGSISRASRYPRSRNAISRFTRAGVEPVPDPGIRESQEAVAGEPICGYQSGGRDPERPELVSALQGLPPISSVFLDDQVDQSRHRDLLGPGGLVFLREEGLPMELDADLVAKRPGGRLGGETLALPELAADPEADTEAGITGGRILKEPKIVGILAALMACLLIAAFICSA